MNIYAANHREISSGFSRIYISVKSLMFMMVRLEKIETIIQFIFFKQTMNSLNLKKLCFALKRYDDFDFELEIDNGDALYKDWGLFEIVSAIDTEWRFGFDVFLWNDFDPNQKELMGLSICDTGIDYISNDFKLLGQSKCYTGTVPAEHLNRVRLNALIINEHGFNSKLIEFSTTPVKLGETRLKFTKVAISDKNTIDTFYQNSQKVSYTHRMISRECAKEIFLAARQLSESVETELKNNVEQIAQLRQYQLEAIASIKPDGITRLHMCCGSGKTILTVDYLCSICTGSINKKFCILVPSLVLMYQWGGILAKIAKANPNLKILPVPVGTGQNKKLDFAKMPQDRNVVFVCVYNSFELISKISFDCVIVDEAHHVDKTIEKLNGYLREIASIPNAIYLSASFGKRIIDYTYSMRTAITDGNLTDYDIIIPYCVKSSVENYFDNCLINYFQQHPEFLSVLVYFNRIVDAQAFAVRCVKSGIAAISMSCEETLRERNEILDKFRSGSIRLIASVNTLGEGVDITNADVCCFARMRASEVSIIQCIGRVLRKHPLKKLAHVILPFVYDDNSDLPIIEFLNRIAKNDPVFYDSIVNRKTGRVSVTKISDQNMEVCDKTLVFDNNLNERITELVFNSTCQIVIHPWQYKLQLLLAYFNVNKKFPGRDSKLGWWLDAQRKLFNKDALITERVEALDKISIEWRPTKMNRIFVDLSWDDKCQLAAEYHATNSKFPKYNETLNELPIGRWLADQRTLLKNNQLGDFRLQQLNTIGLEWSENKAQPTSASKLSWYEKADILKRYHVAFGKLPPNGTVYEDINIRTWLNGQKENHETTPLADDKVAILNSIDPTWNIIKKVNAKLRNMSISNQIDIFERFYIQYNRTPKKAGEVFEDIDIGYWYGNLHKREISAEDQLRMSNIFKDWNLIRKQNTKAKELDWDGKLAVLRRYYQTYSKLPAASEQFESIDIGKWLNTQQTNYKKRSNPKFGSRILEDRVAKLDEITTTWKPVSIE